MLQAFLLVSLLSFVSDSSSTIFAAILIVEFLPGWFLSWLLNVRYTSSDVIVLCTTPPTISFCALHLIIHHCSVRYTSLTPSFYALHLITRHRSVRYTSLDVFDLCATF